MSVRREVIRPQNDSESSDEEDPFYRESNRLATFRNWPESSPTAAELALFGFYSLNLHDLVSF
jgi:hypothetical protein